MLFSLRRPLISTFSQLSAAIGNSSISIGNSNRYLNTTSTKLDPMTATATSNVSKSALMELRKRTGYSISKCKQAIQQFGDDLNQAEEWLQATARKEGWDKISKRASVSTTQGLLGLACSGGMAAIVEVNCQTDFVARNDVFRTAVAQITRGVLNDASKNYRLENNDISTKWNLGCDRISGEGLEFGSKLPDFLADTVSRVGEKVDVGGGFVMRVAPGVSLTGYVHPRSDANVIDGVATGYFAALVAFRTGKSISEEIKSKLGTQICQHIIGMNPSGIGQPPDAKKTSPSGPEIQNPSEKPEIKNTPDKPEIKNTPPKPEIEKPSEKPEFERKPDYIPEVKEKPDQPDIKRKKDKKDGNKKMSAASESSTEEINAEFDAEEARESEVYDKQVTTLSNETTLLRQDFMLEPEMTVYEYLRQFDTDVIDFVRFERGAIAGVHKKEQ